MSSQHIVPFLYEGERMFRAVLTGAQEMWVARDWAASLGYRDPKRAVQNHCKHGRPIGRGDDSSPHGLDPQTIIIPEGDVFRLIVRSNLPGAERLERWLMDEVLPALRRNGSYHMPGAEPAREGEIIAPDDLSSIPLGGKMDLLTNCRLTWGVPATQELWVHLKCPLMPSMEFSLRQRKFDLGEPSANREVAEFRQAGAA